MSRIAVLVSALRQRKDCVVFPVKGIPAFPEKESIPPEIVDFYSSCGGVVLFPESEYPLAFVGPDRFVTSNPVIVGEEVEDDITSSWYIIAEGRSGEYVSIDTAKDRAGRCYDSYIDRHGVIGSCPVIAKSFEFFLETAISRNGNRYYWLMDDFSSFGDAYDLI
jgi:hypothetical protein